MDAPKDNRRHPIRSFMDLEVYQTSYQASLEVIKTVLPFIPAEETDDLRDQLRRSSKAVPRLISEGYSKKHQRRGFQKYLDDALTESNETIVSLSHTRDLYATGSGIPLCEKLVETYGSVSRMIYGLRKAWDEFNTPEDER